MDRDELNYILEILREEIKSGKVRFVEGMGVIDSLQKVKYAEDGKVDVSTVDSRVRSLAMGIASMKQQKELLSIPLKEAQEGYFEILDTFFKEPYELMIKHNLTPYQVALKIASIQENVNIFRENAKNFYKGLNDFWEYYAPVVEAHIINLKGVKSVFGGDLFANCTRNIAFSSGLYIDTIILPDPILRTANLFKNMEPKDVYFLLVKHALNAMKYKELALADLEQPIIIISPDEVYLEHGNKDILSSISKNNILNHINKLFDRSFTVEEEADEFLECIKSLNDLKKAIANPDRLLFDTDWESMTIEERVTKWERDLLSKIKPDFLTDSSVGMKLKFHILGRMLQVNDIVLKSSQFDASPLIDVPTSWKYLLWKYEYDAIEARKISKDIKGLLISNSLTDMDFPLICKLNNKALIKLRKERALAELRTILSKGIDDINEATEDTFIEVSKQVLSNLNEAYTNHKKQVESLSSSKKKFFGFDIVPLIISGGLSIAASSVSNPNISSLLSKLAAGSAVLIGAPSVKEVLIQGSKIIKDNKSVKKSPIGILVKYSNN